MQERSQDGLWKTQDFSMYSWGKMIRLNFVWTLSNMNPDCWNFPHFNNTVGWFFYFKSGKPGARRAWKQPRAKGGQRLTFCERFWRDTVYQGRCLPGQWESYYHLKSLYPAIKIVCYFWGQRSSQNPYLSLWKTATWQGPVGYVIVAVITGRIQVEWSRIRFSEFQQKAALLLCTPCRNS